MNSPRFSAEHIERLASHGLAGCSTNLGQAGSPARNASHKYGRRKVEYCCSASVDNHSWRASSSDSSKATAETFWERPVLHTRKKRRRGRCRGTLQEADYAIYQTLSVDQITEDFLWKRLQPLLKYLDEASIQRVRNALSFAWGVHVGQMRKSGEPYITHPLEVARLLAELRMDMESLCAGLLHDTVEDNPHVASFQEIENIFGPDVRTIVEGETKFSKIGVFNSETVSKGDVKARDLQHLFLAMTKEVRIIVVKLADRLHNMRTLGSMPPHKQKKIAEETLQVFAPLARLLGLYSVKEELEELAFGYSMPDEYTAIRLHLDQLAREQGPTVQWAKHVLEDLLNGDTFLQQRAGAVEIKVMQKSAYSVHRKLESSKKQLNDVTDVAQLCVVIPRKEPLDSILYGTGSQLCYHVMGLVHTKWAPIPGTIKDYIATPKRNGYQSLHTTVLPLGSTPLFPLEVQIRSSKMQKLAEFGIAGEKWVAKKDQNGRVPAAAFSLDADIQQILQQRASKPWLPPDLIGGVFRFLPRMLGFGIPPGPAVNGSARVSFTSSVLSAEQQAQFNARSKRPVGAAYAREVYTNGAYIEGPLGGTAVNGVTLPVVGSARLSRDVMKRREHWLKSIIQWQHEFLDSLTAQEFVDGITGDVLGRGVFVFTPSGEILRLPKDSTTVDFAYHVHTDVGNQMVGAKVNGKLVDPDHILGNAEVVEILTYDGQPTGLSVSRHFEWAKFTKSKTARHKLAKFLKEHHDLLPEHYKALPAGDLSSGKGREFDERPVAGSKLSPSKDRGQTVWLAVEGEDGPGLLAEMAQIIDKHGHDVKTYSGSVSGGTLRMRFEVQGLRGRLEEMCAEIGAARCVRSWRIA